MLIHTYTNVGPVLISVLVFKINKSAVLISSHASIKVNIQTNNRVSDNIDINMSITHNISVRISFKLYSVLHNRTNMSMNGRVRMKFTTNSYTIIRVSTTCS